MRRALENARQREAEISALLKGSAAILHYREFAESALAIFDACKELIGARAGYVALLSEDGSENELLFLESGGLPCTVDPELPRPSTRRRRPVTEARAPVSAVARTGHFR